MARLRTVNSVIDRFSTRGDAPAILQFHKKEVERWSYADLDRSVQPLAAGLRAAGVQRGETVAVWSEHRSEWIVVALAIIRAGGVVVPIDAQLSGRTLKGILDDSGVRILFTTSDQLERLSQIENDSNWQVVLLDREADEDERSWRHWLKGESETEPGAEGTSQSPSGRDGADEERETDPNEDVCLFYTSGTTGPPKGVPLTHAQLAYQLDVVIDLEIVNERDRVLLPLPLHHVYPFVVGMLTPLAIGLPLVLPFSLTGPQVVRAVKEERVSVIIGVPRLYDALFKGIDSRVRSKGRIAGWGFAAVMKLSEGIERIGGASAGKTLLKPLHKQFGEHLRMLASGGSPLDPALAHKLEALGWRIAIGYGLTETAPLLTVHRPGARHLDSVGRPIPGTEVRIDPTVRPGREPDVDDADGEMENETEKERRLKSESVPQSGDAEPSEQMEQRQSAHFAALGEPGEIQARGPGVFRGYRNLPEKTAEAFTDDGWFRTGDLGYFDADGFLHVQGRVSTTIVTEGGENVQPEDVEEAYSESPAIREIGVLARNHHLVGLIVPEQAAIRDSRAGDLEALIRKAVEEQSHKLPSYQRISEYAITLDPLPRTRLGKIQRHELEQRYEEAQRGEGGPEQEPGPLPEERMSAEDRALLRDESARQVWEWLAEQHPRHRLTPDTSPQLDLGIDSLEWLNLTMEIAQRAGVELDEEAINRVDTVRDLLREVIEAASIEGEIRQPLEHPEEVLNDRQKRWLEERGHLAIITARSGYAVNRCLMRTLFRVRAVGVENLPSQGPFVIAANHVSYADPFALAATLSQEQLKEIYWAGWTGLTARNWMARSISRLAQVVPIDPEHGAISSLAFAAAVLRRGKILVWFPEGARSETGELQDFRPGLGTLLDHDRVPVIPVFLHGTYDALPPGNMVPRLVEITAVYGSELDPADLEREGAGDTPRERITNALRRHLEELGRRTAQSHQREPVSTRQNG